MAPIRVLVVDDSALMRQMISRFLEEAGMEVCGTARDGIEGLQKALELSPDVITLDVEMPRMDGLEMLRRLMRERPLPVVMVSSVTQRQAPAAIEALLIGAVDVVAKPGGPISLNLADVRDELVAKVRAAARAVPGERPGAGTGRGSRGQARTVAAFEAAPARESAEAFPPREAAAARELAAAIEGDRDGAAAGDEAVKPRAAGAQGPRGPAPVIVGSSTGGPGALSTLLSGLPAGFPRPIIIVQHMPPGFTASLAHRLDSLSPLSVREAVEGRVPRAGEVWVARGGRHLVFDRRGRMRFSDAPPHLGVRPAVDVTLESAVDVWGGSVLAVILTGMGVDGCRGARKLKKAGGQVLAQDEATSVVYGMPRAVAELALADEIRSLPAMAGALVRAVGACA
ncbi:MAG: chemotaxis response regulator protein-glutamate methylesterase [Firmicutes bacterium]|nr:chemotaxis response regulator protein-glutamate methylesterase [Bacillota bacterium]